MDNCKKTILHIIDDFGLGGAEATVVGVLKNLHEYNNIVVNLYNNNKFEHHLQYDTYYCLDLKSNKYFLSAAVKLRKIIIDNNVDMVHSTLFWSTIIARIATPKRIPLINSIQASISDSMEYKKKWMGRLDRFTYHLRNNIIIGVSKYTLSDYFSFLKLKPYKNYVVYNFVDETIFKPTPVIPNKANTPFKVLSVGSLKIQKNHHFTLQAFRLLKGEDIELDIIGEGNQRRELTKEINKHQLKVRLRGSKRNLQDIYPLYDLFILSSTYEGFALAVLEAMATKTPLLLSRIPAFVEQCSDTADYFNLDDVQELVRKIKQAKQGKACPGKNIENAYQRVTQFYTLEKHLDKLKSIYKEVAG